MTRMKSKRAEETDRMPRQGPSSDQEQSTQPHTQASPQEAPPAETAADREPEATTPEPEAVASAPIGKPTPMRPDEERNWGIMAHVSVFLGYMVGIPVLGPFVVLLLVRDRSSFARKHATEALNFQLSLLLYFLVGTVISVFVGTLALWVLVPVAFALLIAAVVFIVQGALVASAGREYRYPLSIRMVR
jgi:uncharacterized protein